MEDNFGEEYFEKGTLSGYHGYNFGKTFWKALVEDILETHHPKRVLDVGCAKGFLVECFLDFEIEAYGIDISSYALQHAPDHVRPFLKQVDITQEPIPFPDQYFDLITCLDVLEHLSELDHALTEMYRCLRKNGKIVIKVPNPEHPDARGDVTHITILSRKAWIELFVKYGFEVKVLPSKSRGKILKKLPFSNVTRRIAFMLRKRLDNYWFELTPLTTR